MRRYLHIIASLCLSLALSAAAVSLLVLIAIPYAAEYFGHPVNDITRTKFLTGQRGLETYLYPTIRIESRMPYQSAWASGVIIWHSGPWIKVLTAGHVPTQINATHVWIRNDHGYTQHTNIRLIKANDFMNEPDLALYRVRVGDVPVRVAPIAGDGTPVFMERVVAVGCPNGRPQQADVGVYNMDMRQKFGSTLQKFTRTTTPIMNGSSGGPIMKPSGHVIAIVSRGLAAAFGWMGNPIPVTHMNYSVTLDQIHEFLAGVNIK
jgi:hypothetical protein